MSTEASQHVPPLLLPAPRRQHRLVWIGLVVLVAVVALGFFALRARFRPVKEPPPAVPAVAVATVGREDIYNEVTIPAEFRPYAVAELNAKVSGYLSKIGVDFGDEVKEGQVLAVLEVPELKAELKASIAAQQRAEADYTNAHLMFIRLTDVEKEHPNLVAQQDIDTAQAKDSVTVAAVASAKAEVEKYQTLFGYTRIIAPFDGIITWRSADPGALIQAGTSSDTQARPLVRLSDNYLLRLDFPVSVKYVKEVRIGALVTVRVESLDGRTFTGKITRFTHEVNNSTRTMITEIEVKNPDLAIVPGMYATVVLKIDQKAHVIVIPSEAITSAQASTVDVVNTDDKIEERHIILGLETPNFCEVISGLKEGEKVMVGSQSRTHAGEKVEPKQWQAPVAKWSVPKGE